MKVLFLSLLRVVVCAAQEEEAQPSLSELSGQWRTAYIASSNLEKINPNGPFWAYLQKFLFDDEQGTVDCYFYGRHKAKGEHKHITVIKQDDGTYAADFKPNIEEEGLQKFKELTEEKGIDEKNMNFIESEKVTETRHVLVSMESRPTTRR
nr:odorant-binding protein-like isoform X4 [Odocoileus virginianus texanus]